MPAEVLYHERGDSRAGNMFTGIADQGDQCGDTDVGITARDCRE